MLIKGLDLASGRKDGSTFPERSTFVSLSILLVLVSGLLLRLWGMAARRHIVILGCGFIGFQSFFLKVRQSHGHA